MPRRALVTGVAGQDGWYLAKLLLARGYEVVGCGRPGSLLGPRGAPLRELGVKLVELDLLDRYQTLRGVAEVAPDEIYNLAGHSFVPISWDDPSSAIRITSWPVIHLMDAVREVSPRTRLSQGRAHAGRARQSVRRGQGLRPPARRALPGPLRPLRRGGHPLQPRIP